MRSYLTIRSLTTALSGIILGGLALSGAAYAISSAAFRYATPQTGYFVVPATAFMPADNTVVYSNNGFSLVTTGDGCFGAPVNLPQGAKITQLTIWYKKEDTATTANVLLSRAPVGDHFGAEVLAVIIPVNNTGTEIRMSAANVTDTSLQTVNNARFAYVIGTCLSDQETFLSARIKYTYKAAGD